jgi:hypothetical protein
MFLSDAGPPLAPSQSAPLDNINVLDLHDAFFQYSTSREFLRAAQARLHTPANVDRHVSRLRNSRLLSSYRASPMRDRKAVARQDARKVSERGSEATPFVADHKDTMRRHGSLKIKRSATALDTSQHQSLCNSDTATREQADERFDGLSCHE